MSQEFKTFKGYSKKSFEEALESAMKQVPGNTTSVDQLYNYPVIQSGKEIGGLPGRNDYYVVITALINSTDK
jgi:hypothetical protein